MAEDGSIDLQNWNYEQDIVHLEGQWQFVSEKLIDPQAKQPETFAFLTVPGSWMNVIPLNENFNRYGVATYRLLVKNVPTNKTINLYSKKQGQSIQIFINGILKYSNGSFDPDTYSHQNKPIHFPFDTITDTVEIVIHVANFHRVRPGIRQPIVIGSYSNLEAYRNQSYFYIVFVESVLFILCLLSLIIYVSDRREKENFIFFVFCLFLFFRLLVRENLTLFSFFDLSPMLQLRFELFPDYILLSILYYYLHLLYPQDYLSKYNSFFFSIGAIFVTTLFLVPKELLVYQLFLFQVYAVLFLLFSLYKLICIIKNKRELYTAFSICFSLGLTGAIIDLLAVNYFLSFKLSYLFIPVGFFCFHFYLFSLKFIESKVKIWKLNKELVKLNISLKTKVVSETQKMDSFFKHFFDHGLTGMVIVSSKFEWLYINQCFCNILEYSVDEVKKLTWKDFTHPDDIAEEVQLMKSLLSKLIDNYTIDKRYITKTGKVKYIQISVSTHRHNENVELIIANIIDISHRKESEALLLKAKEEAEAASRSKSEFLAMMSHEIRTPMNGILGMAQLINSTPLTTEQKEYIEMIIGSGDTLVKVINDILDFSKIEFGKFKLDIHPFDLYKAIETVVKIVSFDTKNKKLPLHLEISDLVPREILSDENRLKQILLNILNNAVKFTERGGVKLKVRLLRISMEHCRILFKVIDTGIGIPKEKQSLLFASFSQVDISNRRKYGGTGLGLVISKKLCELMDGSISVKSKSNWGTVFSFSIKASIQLDSMSIEKILHNPLKPLSIDQTSLEVLIVEDNFVNQKLLSKLLKKLNILSVIANNGKEAIEILTKKKFPLIFMDIQMPELDGIETTKIIREEMKDNTTIIIALTANAMSGDREKYLIAGMNDYISKPIDFSVVKEKLEQFLQ